jgi:hypothetical protein
MPKDSRELPAFLEGMRAKLNSRDRHQHLIDGERKRGIYSSIRQISTDQNVNG